MTAVTSTQKSIRKGKRVLLALDFYAGDLVTGVVRYAREAGWILCDSSKFGAGAVLDWHGDGAIVMAEAYSHIPMSRLARCTRFPMVDLSDQRPKWNVARVLPDNAAIGRLAAEEFLRRQFDQFAFYTVDRDAPVVRQRMEGFCKAVRAAGYSVTILDYTDHWSRPDAREGLVPWLSRELRRLSRPVAIMAQYDVEALEVIYAALDARLEIPSDIAVMGADNDLIACELGPVPLSSVITNRDEQGYRAAQLLDRLMKGETPPKKPLRIAPGGVVVRQSSDYFAVRDRELASALEYIKANACRRISASDVAAAVGVSRRSLYKKFESLLGIGVHEAIRRRRLERVKELLRDTDRKILEIADDCCFSDASSLSKTFLLSTGVSPGEFRRQFRKG